MPRAAWLPPALLLAYGVVFAARALGVGPLAFDDHPGQLARLIHAIAEGPAPWAWHAGWWAGYPELQFYPPGWFYAGTAVSWLTVGALSPSAVYQALVWVTYLAPGVAAFFLLQRVLGDGWRALPGAFLVLTFAGDPGGGSASGVEGGVHIGMVAARLAWALLPLVALSLCTWTARGIGVPFTATLVIAAIALIHPAHVPAALALLAGAALATPEPRRALARAAAAAALALLLIAFWLVPLLWRLEHTRALAWGALAPGSLLTPFGALLAALVLVAAAVRPARPLLHALGLGVLAVAVDALALEPLGVRFLPADRVADGTWMLVLLAGGAGLGVALGAVRIRAVVPVAALASIALLIAFSWPGQVLALWPRAADWPTLPVVERGLRLDVLWRTVRALPAGRVLFVRSGVPLVYRDTVAAAGERPARAWYHPHTHATALAPAFADREIIGGTFTHGSPVAALVYRGDASRAPIARLAEQVDGVSLFGRPLAALEAATLDEFVRRFRVVAVVALDDDAPQLQALEGGARYRRLAVAPFLVFVAAEAPAAARRIARDRWEVPVSGGDWAATGMAYYPLWRAAHAGRPLPTRRGEHGDLEVRLGGTAPATVQLSYGPGAVELVALGLSAASAAALALGAWRQRRPHVA